MNLSEALDAALPEIPRNRTSRRNAPRLDPDLIIREDTTDGEPIVAVYQRSTASLLRLKPTQWQLASLFDGVRSYEDIAAAFEAETGISVAAEDARTFAENMDESGFWYKNPQEKNLAMNEKLAAQRTRRASGSTFNVAHIAFSAWDPDRYLTRLDRKFGKYVYNRWMVLVAVVLFVFEAMIFAFKWNVIGPDIALYYDFSKKSFSDLAQFWILLMVIGFIHESSHGLTCKHYGGEVHSMGLMFLYLTPAFYVDVTESWISASRLQRMATIIAGIWIEMMLCGIAVFIWMNTQPGAWIHDFCYKLILLTGVAVVVINLNPLIKLDGYYFFSEWLRVPDLKERSTTFLIGWLQRYIFRLPVDVPVVSRRRVPLFVLYALASGGYSYLLLWFFVRFSYNIFFHWFAELALVPATLLGFFIFRSRLRELGNFCSTFYRSRMGAGKFCLTPLRAGVIVALLLLLFVPIFRDRENGYFVIEARDRHEVHAGLPARVLAVAVKEGDAVRAGQVMLTLASLSEASAREEAAAQTAASRANVVEAQMQHSGLGDALTAQQAAMRSAATAQAQGDLLAVTSPSNGVVATSDPASLQNRDVTTGQTLLTIMDPSQLVARLYLPVSEMEHIRLGDRVSLQLPSQFRAVECRLGPIEGSALPLPPGLEDDQTYQGTALPAYYTTRTPLGRVDGMMPGMSGQAKVFGRRRSVAQRIIKVFGDVLHTHFW